MSLVANLKIILVPQFLNCNFQYKMVKNRIKEILAKKMVFTPTEDQAHLLDVFSDFLWDFTDSNSSQDKVLIIKGYAGTGKTSMIAALIKSLPALRLKSVLLAPTGRAAKVLSNYTQKSASTIHKKIYRQKNQKDGIGEFVLDKNLHKRTVFIVDEASMISNSSYENSIFGTGRVLDDLMEYVYTGTDCRLILVGDTAQLPPVGLSISPALNPDVIENMGFQVQDFELTQVVRQKKESGILHNATLLRQLIAKPAVGYPKMELEMFEDIRRISGEDLIEEIETCYSKFGMENTIVICRSNKRANKYNEGIRRTILWREEELGVGDYLMVVKNNYYWLSEDDKETTDFIANGDIAEVTRIGKYKDLYDKHFAEVSLRFLDYPDIEIDANVMLDTLHSETASMTSEENSKFYFAVQEDYMNLRTKKARYQKIKENPYFNALQIKFSYAITCHKAQGGQWKAVFVDQGWINEEMLDTEYLRWLYTAVTRPLTRIYLVNFKDDFFA